MRRGDTSRIKFLTAFGDAVDRAYSTATPLGRRSEYGEGIN